MYIKKLRTEIIFDKIPHQCAIIPAIGFKNHTHYYGYTVISLNVLFLYWGIAAKFGVRRVEDA